MTRKKQILLQLVIYWQKIEKVNMKEEKEIIVTWSRASSILPAMVGHTIAIHNGKEHLPIYITDRILVFSQDLEVQLSFLSCTGSKSKELEVGSILSSIRLG